MIEMVVAHSLDRIIGKDGKLPWKLPSDLKYFRDLTRGHTVIMGRKTYESIPDLFRPLPDRQNIVLSKSGFKPPEDVIVCSNPQELIPLAFDKKNRHFVIGGEEIYNLFQDQSIIRPWRIYVTIVKCLLEDGPRFSKINSFTYVITRNSRFKKRHPQDEYQTCHQVWERIY